MINNILDNLNLYEKIDIIMRTISFMVSIAIPLFAIIVTQYFERKKFNIQQFETNANFNKQLNEERLKHKEVIQEQKDDLRINIMPYLFLLKKRIRFHTDNNESNRIIIDTSFANKGKGTAVNIQCNYINDDKYRNTSMIAKTLSYRYFCYTPFDWQSNVAMTNEIVTMKIMFNKNDVLNNSSSIINSNQFEFKIKYNDVSGNLYIQKFFVQYEFSNNCIMPLLVESFGPVLVVSDN